MPINSSIPPNVVPGLAVGTAGQAVAPAVTATGVPSLTSTPTASIASSQSSPMLQIVQMLVSLISNLLPGGNAISAPAQPVSTGIAGSTGVAGSTAVAGTTGNAGTSTVAGTAPVVTAGNAGNTTSVGAAGQATINDPLAIQETRKRPKRNNTPIIVNQPPPVINVPPPIIINNIITTAPAPAPVPAPTPNVVYTPAPTPNVVYTPAPQQGPRYGYNTPVPQPAPYTPSVGYNQPQPTGYPQQPLPPRPTGGY